MLGKYKGSDERDELYPRENSNCMMLGSMDVTIYIANVKKL